MTAVSYTAKRSLAAGHSVDTVYSMDLKLSALDKDPKRIGRSFVPIGGGGEYQFDRVDIYYSIASIPMLDLSLYTEFLDSVSHGETFDIDIDGTVAAPVSIVDAELSGDYKQPRVEGMIFRNVFRVKLL